MTTTPTFRVADGMLVENAREQEPDDKAYGDSGKETRRWLDALDAYRAHLASLRSIPIAPGCVLEGESLVEGVDFWVGCECDRQGRRGIACLCFCCSGKKAYPIEKELNVAVIGPGDPTPPARAFSLAEATLEIIRLKDALHQIGVACDNQNPTHETIWRIANEALSQTTI